MGGCGQKADVVRESEVGHHRVKEDAPGRCADTTIFEGDDDVEAANGRDNQARRLRPRKSSGRARSADGRLPAASLPGRERVLATAGQTEEPVPQVAHTLTHTFFV